VDGLALLGGDRFWTTHAALAFDQRVVATNRDLVAALDGIDARDVLCEWVPSDGPFVEALQEVTARQGRRVLHVVLTAPLDTLRRRKADRDGDEDVRVGPASIARLPPACSQMVFDTLTTKPDDIAARISAWILSANEPITKL
jgi:hypothetical protein